MPCHRKWCGLCKKAISKRQNIIIPDFLTCFDQEMKSNVCLLTKYKHTADMNKVG